MNLQCKRSIYNQTVAIHVPFTAENLVATHTCTCCNERLVSAIDLEIEHTMKELDLKKLLKPNYLLKPDYLNN
ncbi:MAG TPA: hypothetical protein VK668_15655 [Mucilaginibacter sp.]|nr:hypothetical protein [Mucilaginibacter sp.]